MPKAHETFLKEERILRLGLGTHGLGHAFGGASKEEAMEVFSAASQNIPQQYKLLVDTAPRYGHGQVEDWLGEYLETASNQFLIATKCGRHISPDKDNIKDWTPDFLRYDLDSSLSRLRGNEIFLYQLHNPSLDEINKGEVFEILESFRKDGLIKWYGISVNTIEEGIAAINASARRELPGFISIQFIFSILTKSKSKNLFDAAMRSDIALISREVLFRGFLTDRFLYDHNFDASSSAIQKLIKKYGYQQIKEGVESIRSSANNLGLTLAQIALLYSLEKPEITVTLAGINSVNYFQENWEAMHMSLPVDLVSDLDRFNDLSTTS